MGEASSFLELLRKSKLLAPEQLQAARNASNRAVDDKTLAKSLVQKKWITRWQSQQLLAGRCQFYLGKYRLLTRLGGDNNSGVFLGEHIHMRRRAALKILASSDAQQTEQFLQVVQAVSVLDHRNIVHSYSADNERGQVYLVMEYVDGKDLARVVETSGTLAPADAAKVISQAALGLAHAHQQGIVHAALDPSRLLLDKDGTVKISDFGLGRMKAPNPDSPFQAPERLRQPETAEPACDLYSLGATFCFLLVGHAPSAQTPLDEFFAPRPDMPPELIELCGRLLAVQPQDRYPSAEQLSRELEEWLDLNAPDEDPLAASGGLGSDVGGPVYQPAYGGRRGNGPLWFSIGGLAVCVLLGLFALRIFSADDKPPEDQRELAQNRSSFVDPSVAWEPAGKTAQTKTPPPTVPPAKPPEAVVPKTAATADTNTLVLQGRPTVQDAIVDFEKPAERQGANPRDNRLIQGGRQSALLVRFDLANVKVDTAKLDRAVLSFFVWDPASQAKSKVGAFPVATAWDEATASWSEASAGKPWQGGASFTMGRDTGPALGYVIVAQEQGSDTADPPLEYQVEITAALRSWLEGKPNHGVAIAAESDRSVDEGHRTRFQVLASEYRATEFTPKLTIYLRP